ncbi:hypothetical protein GCM10027614_78780 [Micromonospora vulcania]
MLSEALVNEVSIMGEPTVVRRVTVIRQRRVAAELNTCVAVPNALGHSMDVGPSNCPTPLLKQPRSEAMARASPCWLVPSPRIRSLSNDDHFLLGPQDIVNSLL